MEQNIWIKHKVTTIIFLIVSIIGSTIIVMNMLFNNYYERFKKDTSNEIKQYSQLISYSMEKLANESGEINTIDANSFEKMFKVLDSGEVLGVENKLYTLKYGVYERNSYKNNFVFGKNGFEGNTEYIENVIESKEITINEQGTKTEAFAPIKSSDDDVIGVVQITADYSEFYDDMNFKIKVILILVSSIVTLGGVIRIGYLISKKKNSPQLYKYILLSVLCIALLLSIVSIGSLNWNFNKLKIDKINFNFISNTVSDSKENTYITDNGNTRIIKVNSKNKLLYELDGSKTGKGMFFYAINIAVDNDENLYVLNNVMDESGTYVAKEEILKYNKVGKFLKTIYSKEYEKDNMPLMQGNILGMQNTGNQIYFFESDSNTISISAYNSLSDSIEEKFSVPLPFARSLLNDLALKLDENSIAVTTKNGNVLTLNQNGEMKKIISSEDSSNFIPSQIETDSEGNIYCIDRGSNNIIKISGANIEKILNNDIMRANQININNDARLEHVYCKFSINNDRLVTSEHSYIICINKDGTNINYFDSVDFPVSTIVEKVIFVSCSILSIILLIFLIALKLEDLNLFKKTKSIGMTCIILAAIIIGVSSVTSGYFINNYENKFQEELEMNLKRISYLKSMTIDGDLVDKVNSLSQYMGEDYLAVQDEIKKGFNSFEDEWNVNYYSAIYKKVNDKFEPIAYSDGTEDFLVPLLFNKDNSKKIFREVANYGSTEFNSAYDYNGNWLSGFSPVRNSKGNIVAVLEIGSDANNYSIQKSSIIKEVIINIISIVSVLVFFFIEINMFMEVIFNRNKERKLNYDIKISRFISFLIYSILNIPLFVIPLLMGKILENSSLFNISNEIAMGLPLTGQMICLVLASGIGGTLSDKLGWKPVFICGVITLIGSCFISGIVTIPLLFILSNSLIGFGLGLASIAAQSFIFYSKSLNEQKFDTNETLAEFNSGSYAGANCGVLFGSIMAEKFGYSTAFFSAGIVAIITLLLVLKTIPNFRNLVTEQKEEMSKEMLAKAIFNFEVIKYAILILLPIITVIFFVEHFFPIYSEGQGISSITAGLGYMVQGVTVIYLGPILTKIAIKHLKVKKTLILSSIIAFGGIIGFAFNPTIIFAFITIFMLGVSEAVGQSARVSYLLNMKPFKILGEGKALAVFSVFENLGTVVGPTIFGVILSYNISAGMSIYAGIGLGLAIIFAINTLNFTRVKQKSNEKNNVEGIANNEI